MAGGEAVSRPAIGSTSDRTGLCDQGVKPSGVPAPGTVVRDRVLVRSDEAHAGLSHRTERGRRDRRVRLPGPRRGRSPTLPPENVALRRDRDDRLLHRDAIVPATDVAAAARIAHTGD